MDLEFRKRPKCDPFRFYPPALCIGAAPTLKHRSPSFNPSDLSLHHVCHSPPDLFSLPSHCLPSYLIFLPLDLYPSAEGCLPFFSTSPFHSQHSLILPPLYLGCLYSHLVILLSQSRRGESTLKMKFVGPLVKFDG